MDGLEAFRVNRLRHEAGSEISDKWVSFFQPDPYTRRIVKRLLAKTLRI